METKICKKCNETKSIFDFHLKDRNTGRRKTMCKVCCSTKKPPAPYTESKICIKCNIEKPNDRFYYRKDSGKYRTECKECLIAEGTKRALENPETHKEIRKKTREKNKDKRRVAHKLWRESNKDYRKNYVKNNPEIIKRSRQRTYEKHKERISQKKKIYNANNKEKMADAKRRYAKENRERLRAARRKWENARLGWDIEYSLQKTLRGRIREAMKRASNTKSDFTENLIGCSIPEFKAHIEALFEEGMTWDNWNLRGWHLDHKIPISWFNLESENCRKAAFHYTNQRPMWARENVIKNNKYADPLIEGTWKR